MVHTGFQTARPSLEPSPLSSGHTQSFDGPGPPVSPFDPNVPFGEGVSQHENLGQSIGEASSDYNQANSFGPSSQGGPNHPGQNASFYDSSVLLGQPVSNLGEAALYYNESLSFVSTDYDNLQYGDSSGGQQSVFTTGSTQSAHPNSFSSLSGSEQSPESVETAMPRPPWWKRWNQKHHLTRP